MVFSSHDVPVYLDPPNWHQQHNHQGTSCENPQLPPLPPPAAPHVGPGAGSNIRPGSMSDRARLAKIPQPEAALKCPRCESTNTKFCYFNNYNLSQPRHFCKTCRRYWTRGGALRNVPVGGGYRRNKKHKSSSTSSKSPASAKKQVGSNSTNAHVINIPSTEMSITGLLPQQTPHLPFMDSLQSFVSLKSNSSDTPGSSGCMYDGSDRGVTFSEYGLGNIGLNFGGLPGQTGVTRGASGQAADMGFLQIGTSNSGMTSAPFFEPANGLYQFQNHGIEASSSVVGENRFLRSISSSSRVSQVAPVKMENSSQGLNLSRPVLDASENNQYLGGNSWTDLSGLNSSSTTNHLL